MRASSDLPRTAIRLLAGSLRAGLHAAVVLSVAVSLFLLFLLWAVLQFFDSPQ